MVKISQKQYDKAIERLKAFLRKKEEKIMKALEVREGEGEREKRLCGL
jgi:excinuclease UvrABC nuclease subunit